MNSYVINMKIIKLKKNKKEIKMASLPRKISRGRPCRLSPYERTLPDSKKFRIRNITILIILYNNIDLEIMINE